MNADTVAPSCASDPDLFSSTAIDDHIAARKACEACPMLADCRDRLAAEMEQGLPVGTWAGVLLVDSGGRSRVVAGATSASLRNLSECCDCHKWRRIVGRGICAGCHKRNTRAGTLDRFPTAAERSRRNAQIGLGMIREGLTYEAAAGRLGLKKTAPHQSIKLLLQREARAERARGGTRPRDSDDFDATNVTLVLGGEWRRPGLTRAERLAVIAAWRDGGGSIKQLIVRTGWNVQRDLRHDRQQRGEQVAS